MKFNMITIFPEFFGLVTDLGVIGRAKKSGLIEVNALSPRAFTTDVHQTVDDRPFGGGDGMVMMAGPLMASLNSLGEDAGEILVMSPAGEPFSIEMTKELVAKKSLTIVSGRYAGIDQRFVQASGAREVSVGDYVLSGGEPAALCLLDAVTRLVPGVLGHPDSAEMDSFFDGLLEAPSFSRPQNYEGVKVPDFLLSGDHKAIQQKRLWLSLLRTRAVRPELIKQQHQAELRLAMQWFLALDGSEIDGLGMRTVRQVLISQEEAH